MSFVKVGFDHGVGDGLEGVADAEAEGGGRGSECGLGGFYETVD